MPHYKRGKMDEDKKLDNGIEETMDASDPVSIEETLNPAPSSGFPEKKSWLDRVRDKLFTKRV